MSCNAWASFKTGAPKLSAALIFLWLLSFYQEKESNVFIFHLEDNSFLNKQYKELPDEKRYLLLQKYYESGSDMP